MGLDYLKTKLLDYKNKWLYLENHDNPFTIVVMAHLKAMVLFGLTKTTKRIKT